MTLGVFEFADGDTVIEVEGYDLIGQFVEDAKRAVSDVAALIPSAAARERGLGGNAIMQDVMVAPNGLDLRQAGRFSQRDNALIAPTLMTADQHRWKKAVVGWAHSGLVKGSASAIPDPYIAQRMYATLSQNQVLYKLYTLLGDDWEVFNRGIATQPPASIAARMGAVPIRLTVTGNSVPASGTVNCTAISPNPINPPAGEIVLAGTINGAKVRLTNPSGTVRVEQAPGAAGALAVPAGSTFVPATGGLENAISIIWLDRNSNDLATMKYLTGRMAARVKGGRVLFLGDWNTGLSTLPPDEGTGTPGYNAVEAINAAYREMWPANFLDVRAFLRGDFPYDNTIEPSAWTITGLSPTATDTADIAAGYLPTAFFDGGHLNDAGNLALAKYLAWNAFPNQGWL